MQPQSRYDLYAQLEQLPGSLTGEILNGQLYAHPRPSGKHVQVAFNLGLELGGPYYPGKGGPGGWRILQEPEVHLVLDHEVVVPDLAGWRIERLPYAPESHKFTVVPDWVCKVFSPSTEGVDREIKVPLYAQYGVKYLWLIHPIKKQLDAYKLVSGEWQLQGTFESGGKVCVEPFESIELNIDELME